MLPIPQRYYVPGRIRDSYRPRLEASGLWNLPGVEEEKGAFKETKKPEIQDRNTKYVKVFEREKVRAILGFIHDPVCDCGCRRWKRDGYYLTYIKGFWEEGSSSIMIGTILSPPCKM
jgi:hypothetical protein